MSGPDAFNRTRLSMALVDLPLTPIGMKLINDQTNSKCNNKPMNHEVTSRHKKRFDNSESKENVEHGRLKVKKSFFKLFPNTQKPKNIQKPPSPKPRLVEQEAAFSDIEEGSFVEFVEPKEIGHLKNKALYYTCPINNETQCSTSSKKASTDYGFRQYVDAMKKLSKSPAAVEDTTLTSRPSEILCSTAINDTFTRPHFADLSTVSLESRASSVKLNFNMSPELIELSDTDDDSPVICAARKKLSILTSDESLDEVVDTKIRNKPRGLTQSWTTEDISIVSTPPRTPPTCKPDILRWVVTSPFQNTASPSIPRHDLEGLHSNVILESPDMSPAQDSLRVHESNRSVMTIGKDYISPTKGAQYIDSPLPDLERTIAFQLQLSMTQPEDEYHLEPVDTFLPANSSLDDSFEGISERKNVKKPRQCVLESSECSVNEISESSECSLDLRSRIKKKLAKSPPSSPVTKFKLMPRSKLDNSSDSDDADTPNWFSSKKNPPKTKLFTKIPPTPSRRVADSSDEETQPTWFSTKKKPPKTRIIPQTPTTTQSQSLSSTKSLLQSLSESQVSAQTHPEATCYINNFKKHKTQLMHKLFSYYNTHVFADKLPAQMSLKWNARITKTAGFCYYQIDKSAACGKNARIELSSKVIDSADRLRDTLIHEMCHAAAWIISGYKCGHGKLWKAWASLARRTFPELPDISRCHSYEIACKYTYRCSKCHYEIGRHSKSLDMDKKVCGYCYGKFELIVNSLKKENEPSTPRTAGPFALFVKENYSTIKKSTGTTLKHGDIMKELSKEFGKMKSNLS